MTITAPLVNPRLLAEVRQDSEASARLARQEDAFLQTVGILGLKHENVRRNTFDSMMREKPRR